MFRSTVKRLRPSPHTNKKLANAYKMLLLTISISIVYNTYIYIYNVHCHRGHKGKRTYALCWLLSVFLPNITRAVFPYTAHGAARAKQAGQIDCHKYIDFGFMVNKIWPNGV